MGLVGGLRVSLLIAETRMPTAELAIQDIGSRIQDGPSTPSNKKPPVHGEVDARDDT